MAQVNFRIDDELKVQADTEFKQMGLTLSAAITLLCTQVVLKHRLPFSIEGPGAADSRLPRHAKPQDGVRPGKRMLDFIRANPIDVPADFKWTRAEANERDMRCLK